MRSRRAHLLAAASGAAALALSASPAFAGLHGHGAPPASSYVGPGNVVSGWVAWWGLRAFSATWADGAHAAINVNRASDAHSCDVLLTFNTGLLGNTTNCSTPADNGTAWATWGTATTVRIGTFYDQTGDGFALSQATVAQQAVLTPNCIGALPCAVFDGSPTNYANAISAIANPFSVSMVGARTAGFTVQNDVLVSGGGGSIAWGTGGNNIQAGFGGFLDVTASDSVIHPMQFVTNGASSFIQVDATSTSGNIGTVGFGANSTVASVSNAWSGDLLEMGVGNGAWNGTQATNICHNQFTYWGTATSC